MRERAGKRGSGGIWLERLGDSDPVLWCEDADGKRGTGDSCNVVLPVLSLWSLKFETDFATQKSYSVYI